MALALFLLALAVPALRADTLRTQEIQLQRGWNAVFLEVFPSDSTPAAVFTGTPVDIVASYFARNSSAQFITDPGANMFQEMGWGVWYATNRADAFLKTLHSIYGQQPYLVHAKSDFTWRITGTVQPGEVRWQPDSYNFTGAALASSGAPTFAQFFAGSQAHRHNRIYRLANGAWRRVSDPTAEAMRAGEAFWIYCDGNSRYQGPLEVETSTRNGVVLTTGADAVILRNQTGHPVAPTVEHVASGSNSVPLSIVVQVAGTNASPERTISVARPDGNWTQPLPALEAGGAVRLPLEARVREVREPVQESLLKITTDLVTEVWIPVVSIRTDLQGAQ
jgi:hypothetical protein